jgi:hypothetical protein
MSWDCPYLKNDICELNNIDCKPALGNCILKGKVVPVSKLNKKKVKSDKPVVKNVVTYEQFINKKRSD